MTTTTNKNERLALLLGWRYSGKDNIRTGARLYVRGEVDWTPGAVHGEINQGCPDYTTWERFPEMQEYVRGLQTDDRTALWHRVVQMLDLKWHPDLLFGLTPTILRDAILEVCGE